MGTNPDWRLGYYSVYDQGAERWYEWPIHSVSAADGRLRLVAAGLYDACLTAISQADAQTKIWFEYATEWERAHPAVIALGATLGLTPEEIDTLFMR